MADHPKSQSVVETRRNAHVIIGTRSRTELATTVNENAFHSVTGHQLSEGDGQKERGKAEEQEVRRMRIVSYVIV